MERVPEFIVVLVVVLLVQAVGYYVRRSNLLRSVKSPPSSERREVAADRAFTAGNSGNSESDIFLSYATPNRPTAKVLAAVLSTKGLSVWWDREIPPGQTFDSVIEMALGSAKCVIVLWSSASVSSDWVKVEAAEGARRGVLVPALIEDVTIPLEFRRIQAANLTDWRASTSHPGFQSLVSSVTRIIEKSRQPT